MAGFYINNFGLSIDQELSTKIECVKDELDYKEFHLSRCTLPKFLDDKLFYSDIDVILVLEGVILNKQKLCGSEPWNNWVKRNFLETGIEIVNKFRGPFAGAFCNKLTGMWYFFTSHIGDKMVYYYQSESYLVVANSFNEVLKSIKLMSIEIQPNQNAIYDMLTFGFMTADHTLVSDIKRIEAGHYLCWDGKELSIKQYHAFTINDSNHGMDEALIIQKLDELFTEAVKMEFDKDVQEGYRHLTCLSGGLDSRLTTWVAHELGYKDLVAIEFGKGDYLDEKIAKQIAEKLGIELIVKPLDDATFMREYHRTVDSNGGLSLYYGTAHGNSMYRLLNFSEFGLVHTGDEQLFWKYFPDNDYTDVPERRMLGAYSRTLSHRYQVVGRTFPHLWEFWMYTRGFLGNLNSINAKNDYAIHSCPFLDVDFAEFVFSTRIELWKNDYIYLKWFNQKYPEACKIPVERYKGAMMSASPFIRKMYFAKHLGARNLINWTLGKMGIQYRLAQSQSSNDMNPLDLWYTSKPAIASKMDDDMDRIIKMLFETGCLSDEVLSDLTNLYKAGNAKEKTQVMTVLAAMDIFILDALEDKRF